MKIERVKGIVISEVQFRENDKMLTVFSDLHGKISVFARGAKKSGSKFTASAQVFCYSELELVSGKTNVYTLRDAHLIESFYGLRTDLDKLTYASKIVRLASKVIQEELEDKESLRLILNSLHFLSESENEYNKFYELIYCVFRMRLVYLQGYLPPVTCKYSGTELAIEHICNAWMEKLFKFAVSDEVLVELGQICDSLIREMLEGV